MEVEDIKNSAFSIDGDIFFDHSIKNLNWFNIGEKTKILFKPHSLQGLIKYLKLYAMRGKIFILGNGSNVLFDDETYPGTVIKLGKSFSKITLLDKETIFSERVNGEFELRRDFTINKNQKVLIIEDVITTGKSSLECSKIVEDNNAIIVGYACLIDRSNGKSAIKEKIVSQVKIDIPTYTEKNLPKNLLTLKAVKPGSRNL